MVYRVCPLPTAILRPAANPDFRCFDGTDRLHTGDNLPLEEVLQRQIVGQFFRDSRINNYINNFSGREYLLFLFLIFVFVSYG